METNKDHSIYGRYGKSTNVKDEYRNSDIFIKYNKNKKTIDIYLAQVKNEKEKKIRSYTYQELGDLAKDYGSRQKYTKDDTTPSLYDNIQLIQKKQNRKLFSKEDYEKANSSNLLEFIEKQNINLEQVGADSYKGTDHDSLVITPSANAWFWNSRQVGGFGAKSFAEKYILADQQMSDKDKDLMATKMVLESNVSIGAKKIKRDPFQFRENQVSNNFDQAADYLVKERGINPKLISRLHKIGLLEQDREGNALFLWSNLDQNQVVGTSVQGTVIDHDKFGKRGTLKKIEKNSTSGMGWSFDVKKRGTVPENIVFAESCIDAISYYNSATLAGKPVHNTRIVSMEGLKKSVVENYIAKQTEQLEKKGKKLKSVKFAVDRDEAGDNFVKKMKDLQETSRTKESKFNQENTKFAVQDDFAADMQKFDHKNNYNKQVALAKAPNIQSAQPPKSSEVKDWNDFLKKANHGNLRIIKNEINKKITQNLTIGKSSDARENIYKPVTQSIFQQYLENQNQDMNY